MAAAQIPGFETPVADTDWFTATLGGAVLPGIVTIENLKVGIDVDTKKAKGSDQPTSKDNGVEPTKFDIRVWMNSAHYKIWQAVLPHFNPRRPGRERAPLEILHPMTHELGVRNVRVLTIEAEQPSGTKGFVRVIKCEEWFDKPKPVAKPKAKKEQPLDSFDWKHLNEAIAVGGGRLGTLGTENLWGHGVRTSQNPHPTAEELDPNTFQPIDPSNTEGVEAVMFSDDVRSLAKGLKNSGWGPGSKPRF